MKKPVFTFLLLFVLSANVNFASDITFENVTWLDNQAVFDDHLEITEGGHFYLSICEFILKGKLTDKLTAKISLNMTKSETFKDSYFKTAFFEYAFLPELKLTVGLQQSTFGYFKFWRFQLPLKYYTLGNITPPTDLGIGIGGTIGGIVDYHLQVLNGEGYKTWYETDNLNYCAIADVRVKLGKLFGIGVSWKKADADFKFLHAFSVYVDLIWDRLKIAADYFTVMEKNRNFTHFFTSFVQYSVSDKLDLIARTDLKLNDMSSFYAGCLWQFTEYTALKPMIGLHSANGTLTYELLGECEIRFGIRSSTTNG